MKARGKVKEGQKASEKAIESQNRWKESQIELVQMFAAFSAHERKDDWLPS